MIDVRPVGYVTGLLVAFLGATMLVPMMADMAAGNGEWPVFLESAIVTSLAGGLTALACSNGVSQGLTRQQTFLLAPAIWFILPVFGAIPFVLGATEARVVDALFEAMSGITTTGSTVFVGLDHLPWGILLWRSMLQWFGGIGIIVVAMVFLPELRVGGMQMFRSEAFETMGKILPRAAEIAARISWIYVWMTFACYLAYLASGMSSFDAINHALTTLATGGFSTRDASFGAFSASAEYVATLFMFLAALPFVLYVQVVSGTTRPLLMDSQVRAFFGMLAVATSLLALYLLFMGLFQGEASLREALFNVTSIATGTGYASVDYQLWGPFAMVVFFAIGLVGGCAGSTTCSIKIFRYQILFSAIRAQIRRIHQPHGLFVPRYGGKPVTEDVLSSVMALFVVFIVSIGGLSVLLTVTGLDLVTSLSGAATAILNIGPGLGDRIGPAGNFAGLNDSAKWLQTAAMLVGRLELMVVLVLFTRTFWRG
ncbi:TrkH family potassium uptake protein [Roseitranquillus sediminis]|uniref:TrkH family potassium uptake protein n=1 Tax=Roseitranquillus sediminis TaxID=2809051 RepID=UPI001D0CC560|nr:TrkH family potassium uptake protein [Roseitranquillus sediminis]MBM9594670.1 TrkH family potassium uptake protein [Roseitranquillus sediminis]